MKKKSLTKFPKRYHLVITKRLPFRKKHEVRLRKGAKFFVLKWIPFRNLYSADRFLLLKQYETVCVSEVFVGQGRKSSEMHTVSEVRIGTVLEIK